ncbi:molybdopterin-dependent oxidoreductase [Deinococcus roseus]|uniref:Oxidoreductase molybdopterin-binding domain-containing protein n=1 Tax=Deinococcus roseus TaxID=392414 RepID=A0ABQ2D156_9DEIO|nr:molybdopterin-dependent oxidoreductase [Deinococcus roseus]GGJ37742.1 hypothetical protein GCM10008938_24800 [Deinococcus roseus]
MRPEVYQEVHPAQNMPAAGSDPVVLTIESSSGKTTLTQPQLESLRVIEYRTSRPDDASVPHTYQGVMVADLLDHLRLTPKKLYMVATNDYSTFINAEDVLDYPVMIAFKGDGRPLTIEDKGPLLVVFPTHAYAERFNTLEYGSKWVWFLKSIRVE